MFVAYLVVAANAAWGNIPIHPPPKVRQVRLLIDRQVSTLEGLDKSLNSGDTRLFLVSHLEALRRNNTAQEFCFSQGEGFSLFQSRGWSRVCPALRARPQQFGTVHSMFAMGSLSLTIRWHSRSVIRMTCSRSIVSQIGDFVAFCDMRWGCVCICVVGAIL